MVSDAMAPIWHKGICNHGHDHDDDAVQSTHIGCLNGVLNKMAAGNILIHFESKYAVVSFH